MKTFLGLKSIHARLIAAAILAVGMSQSYAAVTVPAVTVPNTFTAGTPALAADVNTNFTGVATQASNGLAALGSAMPAVKTVLIPSTNVVSATGVNVASITVTPPSNGFVVVSAVESWVLIYLLQATLAWMCF